MNRPAHPAPYADRLIDCEFALETLFDEMLDKALAAGWSSAETCVAMSGLADHHMLKTDANSDVARQIAEACKARGFSARANGEDR
jgi:hypothetical protein